MPLAHEMSCVACAFQFGWDHGEIKVGSVQLFPAKVDLIRVVGSPTREKRQPRGRAQFVRVMTIKKQSGSFELVEIGSPVVRIFESHFGETPIVHHDENNVRLFILDPHACTI